MVVSELQSALAVTGTVFLVLVGVSAFAADALGRWWGWLMFWVCVVISAMSFLACAWVPVFA